MDLLSLTQRYQAAILRGDEATARVLWQEAHDMLDVNLRMNAEAARATRALLNE